MPARHRSRQHALQVLFSWDLRKQPVDEALDAFWEIVTRRYPDAFGLVEEAARAGERGQVVRTLLGLSAATTMHGSAP